MDLTAWQQAQSAVLGSLLIDPEHTAGLVFAQARAEHFSDAGMRHVFEAARDLWREKRPVDPVTVADACGGAGTVCRMHYRKSVRGRGRTGYHIRQHCNADRSGRKSAAAKEPLARSAAADRGKHSDRAVCAALCIRCRGRIAGTGDVCCSGRDHQLLSSG